MVSTCTDTQCEGHLGKFQSCLTEALWTVSLDGTQEDQTGDVDAYGYYVLLHFPDAEHIDISDNPPLTRHMVEVPAGWYVVETMSSGAVYHSEYGDEAEAYRAFKLEVDRYEEWDEDDD